MSGLNPREEQKMNFSKEVDIRGPFWHHMPPSCLLTQAAGRSRQGRGSHSRCTVNNTDFKLRPIHEFYMIYNQRLFLTLINLQIILRVNHLDDKMSKNVENAHHTFPKCRLQIASFVRTTVQKPKTLIKRLDDYQNSWQLLLVWSIHHCSSAITTQKYGTMPMYTAAQPRVEFKV